MRNSFAVLSLALVALTACNKSSPPPQKPLTPRTAIVIELPLQAP
ncbi:MAG: hypothetical protein ACJ8IR_02970 [Alphaproteobacteria bacterium]|jgi:hypothetical protein